jgi:hypothetical protein
VSHARHLAALLLAAALIGCGRRAAEEPKPDPAPEPPKPPAVVPPNTDPPKPPVKKPVTTPKPAGPRYPEAPVRLADIPATVTLPPKWENWPYNRDLGSWASWASGPNHAFFHQYPDGKHLLVSAEKGYALYEAGGSARRLDEYQPGAVVIAIRPDGRWVMVVSSSPSNPKPWKVFKWNPETREEDWTANFTDNPNGGTSIYWSMSRDGKRLAGYWEDVGNQKTGVPGQSAVRVVLDGETGRELRRRSAAAKEQVSIHGLRILPDGKAAVYVVHTPKAKNAVRLVRWDLEEDTEETVLVLEDRKEQWPNVELVAVSPDGKLAGLCDARNSCALVVDLTSGAVKARVVVPDERPAIAFSPDGRHAAVSGGHVKQGYVALVDLQASRSLGHHRLDTQPLPTEFTPDGRGVLLGLRQRVAYLPVPTAKDSP